MSKPIRTGVITVNGEDVLLGDLLDYLDGLVSGSAGASEDYWHETDGTTSVLTVEEPTAKLVIPYFKGTNLTSVGMRFGTNDYAESLNWRGPTVLGGFIDEVGTDDESDLASHYGLITYVPETTVIGFSASNIRGQGDMEEGEAGDTECLYAKSRHGLFVGVRAKNGGRGEAAINIKGSQRGETGSPLGYGVGVYGFTVVYDDDYLAASPEGTAPAGINLANDNIVAIGGMIEGAPGSYIMSHSSPYEDLICEGVLGTKGDVINGGLFVKSNGGVHSFSRHTIRVNAESPGSAVRVQGQDVATRLILEGNRLVGGEYSFLLRPDEDSILDVIIRGGTVLSPDTALFILQEKRLRRLIVENVAVEDVPAGTGCVFSGSGPGVDHIVWRGVDGIVRQTADATPVPILTLPTAYGGVTSVKARITGTDGTSFLCREHVAVYKNVSGTVTQIGSGSTPINEVDGTSWTTAIAVSGQTLQFQVTGEASTTINWTIDAEVVG